MTDQRIRHSPPPERLRQVLDRLDEVLLEAERLRNDITRRLDSQRVDPQHLLSGSRRGHGGD